MSVKQRFFTVPTGRYRKVLGYSHTVIGFGSLLLLYKYPEARVLFVIGVSSLGAATVYLLKKDNLSTPVE